MAIQNYYKTFPHDLVYFTNTRIATYFSASKSIVLDQHTTTIGRQRASLAGFLDTLDLILGIA